MQEMAALGNPRGSIIKVALTAAAGATIEWYDFFVYGTAAALVFPKLFFPATLSPFVAQLAAFSTFAVGFLARPFGGVIFGHFGDLYGRKRALSVALLIMGCVSTLVGLLPTYAMVGVLAPVLLVVLRFVQGLAIGGQWGGAVLLAVENAPPNRRGYYGSFAQIGVPAGLVLSNVIFLVVGARLSPAAFEAWGWRVPFLFSILLVGVGLYVQLRLEESMEFAGKVAAQPKAARTRSPVIGVILSHPKQIILAGGAFLANNICFYIGITYAIAYGTSVVHLPKSVMLSAVMISGVVMVPVLIFCGRLSDKWGRLGIFMVGAALTGVWSLLFFPLIETGSSIAVIADIIIVMFLLSLMYGPQAALFAELFPVEMRYSGASLGYQLGSIVGGGFAPIIATALFEKFKTSFAIGLYMMAACAITFLCTFLLTRRGRRQPA
jgi:metabolite-proton symporter